MSMRKDVGLGIAVTVIAGVILLPITTWWNKNEQQIPEILVDAASLIWSPVTIPLAVAVFAGAATLWGLLSVWRHKRLLKHDAALDPNVMEATARPRSIFSPGAGNLDLLKLNPEEEAVLTRLAGYGNSVEKRNLRTKLDMTDFRYERAIGGLAEKLLIRVSANYKGTTISFTQSGRNYVASRELDKA